MKIRDAYCGMSDMILVEHKKKRRNQPQKLTTLTLVSPTTSMEGI